MRGALIFALLIAVQFAALGVLAEAIEQPSQRPIPDTVKRAQHIPTRVPASLKTPEIDRGPLSTSEQMLKYQRRPIPTARRSPHGPYYAGLCRDAKGAQYDLAQNTQGYTDCLEDERHQSGLALIFPLKR